MMYNDVMTAKRRGKKPLHGTLIKAVVGQIVSGKTDNQILAKYPNLSQSSISRIKKTKAEMIEAKKEQYVKMIDSIAGDKIQALKLAEMVNAETPIYNFQGKQIGTKPDFKNRLEAIKYIDNLKGRVSTIKQATQNNIIISKQLDKYTS